MLPEGTEKAIWAAYHNATADNRPTPKELAATLQTTGHKVSERTVQRRYGAYDKANAAHGASAGAQRWRLTDARDPEELALILPAVATSHSEGRELSKDEAAIFLALRRALPQQDDGFLLYLTHHYDSARRGETSVFGPTWSDYTVDEIDEWVAFAHVDQTQPGTLEKATEAGLVRKIGGWVGASIRLVEPRVHTCGREFWNNENYERHAKDCDGMPVATITDKRKGGTGRGKKK